MTRAGFPRPVAARTGAGRWWMDLTLRRKLLSIMVLVALVCGPPIVIGLVFDARARHARDEADRTTESIDALAALERTVQVDAGLITQRYTILFFDAPRSSSSTAR